MLQITLKIDGMMCAMCESHINDTIRKNFNVKKVTSSHTKGQTMILSEDMLPEDQLKKAIAETGYVLNEIQTEEYQRKKLFGLF